MTVSKAAMVSAIRPSSERTSPSFSEESSAWAISRLRSPRRCDTSSASRVASAMMPKPPIWVSTVSSTCPKPVQ